MSGTAAAQGVCPEYPGESHEQIIFKVEGRMQGNWNHVIQATRQAIKRQRAKGEDTSMGELFVEVLLCLRDEMKTGAYADLASEARARMGKGKGGSGPTKADLGKVETTSLDGGGGPGATASGSWDDTASGSPAPDATVSQQELSIAQLPPPEPAAPQPEPAPQPSSPPLNAVPSPPLPTFGEGAALPGTAESYALTGSAPPAVLIPLEPPPQPQQQAAAAPPPAPAPQPSAVDNKDYSGQACIFFTRPYEEWIDGIRHINRYTEGEWVCHAGTMYACTSGAWQNKGGCAQYSLWETRTSAVLEAKPR